MSSGLDSAHHFLMPTQKWSHGPFCPEKERGILKIKCTKMYLKYIYFILNIYLKKNPFKYVCTSFKYPAIVLLAY